MIVQLWETIRQNAPTAAFLIIVASFIIQITPIKINPWSALFAWIGKNILNDTTKKVDNLIRKIDTIEQNVSENEKDRIRWEILDFANSCRNNRRHTRDEFQHIITLNTKYKKLLEETNDANGVFEVEMEYIKHMYAESLEKNDFLT